MAIIRFEAPTWNEVYSMLIAQASKLRHDFFRPDIILGVSRGGLISARIHSDLLENSNLVTIRTECYLSMGEAKSEPTLKEPLSESIEGKSVLVVDDIADSGRSLKLVKAHVIQRGARVVRVATLFRKPWSGLKPDYFEKETELWVVFPWDLRETVREAFEKRGEMPVSELAMRLADAGLPKEFVLEFLEEMSGDNSC